MRSANAQKISFGVWLSGPVSRQVRGSSCENEPPLSDPAAISASQAALATLIGIIRSAADRP
jgi:hypothetical protein